MNSILLVDDETVIGAEIAQTLEGLGFEVEVASTVESGLSRAETARFDAILVEFNVRSERGAHLRSGNGLKVIHQLRALDIPAPVLMFTAMEAKFYETVSLEAGADDFLLKTASIPRLVSRIRAHIRRHEQGLGKRTKSERSSI